MKSFLGSVRFYLLFISALSLAFLLTTFHALWFDSAVIITSLFTGFLIGVVVLVIEIYRNADLLKSAGDRRFLISNLPLGVMIVLAIIANLQHRKLEYAILLMVGSYLAVYIFGIVMLKFLFGKNLQWK